MTMLNIASSMRNYKSKIDSKGNGQATLSSKMTRQKEWQNVIDKLSGWQWDIEQLEDEGVIPPSEGAIQTAIDLAMRLDEEEYVAPSSVVPDGDGGIVLTHRNGNIINKMHVWEEGSVCLSEFEGTSLIRRTPITLV